MAKTGKTKYSEKQRIITPEFRVAFPHLLKPHRFKETDDLKYSVTMLFKKTKDLSTIKAAMKEAKISFFGKDKSAWPEDLESPIVDGDEPKHVKKEGYKGHWAIKASAPEDRKPGLIDEEDQLILDSADFLPGYFARAQVFCHVWEYGGKQGIRFSLDHVKKTREGKVFGGRKSAVEAFASIGGSDEDDGSTEDGDDDGDDDDSGGSFM